MKQARFHLTETARAHLKSAVRETHRRWGSSQAKVYSSTLRAGFQFIADNHPTLPTSHREALAEGTHFRLHLVGHRYVVFQVHDRNSVIIAAPFHERMDIPARLQELATTAPAEIKAIPSLLSRGG